VLAELPTCLYRVLELLVIVEHLLLFLIRLMLRLLNLHCLPLLQVLLQNLEVLDGGAGPELDHEGAVGLLLYKDRSLLHESFLHQGVAGGGLQVLDHASHRLLPAHRHLVFLTLVEYLK
jgi:hypothetical protein